MMRLFVVLIVLLMLSCGQGRPPITEPTQTLPKNVPLDMTYENVSLLLEDMERFTQALKPLNLEAANRVNERYTEVIFEVQRPPLFVNVYPDPENKRVVFLISPKDPKTGAPFLLQYDKKLPVVNEITLEMQIRTRSGDEPLTCLLDHEEPQAYVEDVRSHLFSVKYTLYKMFLQSGTFDFDGLTIATYRQRGYPFIVFDLKRAELADTTAKLSCDCR